MVVLLACGGSRFHSVSLARRRRRHVPAAEGPPPPPSEVASSDPSIRWAESVRRVLVVRFGPAWAAKTSEEIAGAAEVVDRLGAERASALRRLLAAADFRKFSGQTTGPEIDGQPDGNAALRDDLLAALIVDQGRRPDG